MKFIILAAFMLLASSKCLCYDYQTLYFEQPVDQFSFQSNDTYKQRYLLSTKHWNKTASGPIFFYVGNEGDIEVFAENTGFMWEIAPEFGAMVLFSEHRFYGKSMPYTDKFGLLTSEQALADHARLVLHVKKTIAGASGSPVIAFGGSYGGMLASWMRIKYPHVIDGALAASAPVLQFTDMVPCDAYARSVTKAFKWGGNECPSVFRRGFDLIQKNSKSSQGLVKLTKIFKLCRPLTDGQLLIDWMNDGLSSTAMANYPYPNSFLGKLPAWPVRKACSFLTDSTLPDDEILNNIFQAMSVYYNYTSSQPKCIDLNFNPMGPLGADNWNYQACTEMVMPMCNTGVYDMFLPQSWNITKFSEGCAKLYGVKPRPYMANLMYGGDKLKAASNIIYSNGEIDPWNGGGIHKSINPTVVAIPIADGAHHLDLRSSNKVDPPSVVKARILEKQWIKQWIAQVRNL